MEVLLTKVLEWQAIVEGTKIAIDNLLKARIEV